MQTIAMKNVFGEVVEVETTPEAISQAMTAGYRQVQEDAAEPAVDGKEK
jgi:hypothetical protein